MEALLKAYGVGKRHPNDQFFEEGDQLCKPLRKEGIFDVDDEDLCHPVIESFECPAPGCSKEMRSLLEFETHYNLVHRYICVACKKYLPTPHLLDLHVAESHDSFFLALAERQPMYRCYVESCSEVFNGPASRRSHCIEDHKYPPDFRFDKPPRQKPHHLVEAGGDSAGMAVDCEGGTTATIHKVKMCRSAKKRIASGVLGPKLGIGCDWHRKKGACSSGGKVLEGNKFVTELKESLPK